MSTDYTEADLRHNAGYPELPLTPYAGTSGWRGSEASRDRVKEDDANGATSLRQRVSLYRVYTQGARGLTWKELGEIENWHAGQSSGSLSVLHKEGLIYRLTEKRNRCSVYVTEEFINGRATSERKTQTTCKHCGGKL
jgi:hypothetical protein